MNHAFIVVSQNSLPKPKSLQNLKKKKLYLDLQSIWG